MENSSVIKTIIIAVSVIVTGYILGHAVKKRNAAEDSIAVVGLGTKTFTSDEILFSGYYNAKSMDAKDAFAQINSEKEQVKGFFLKKNFTVNEIVFGGVTFEKQFRTVTIETNGESNKTEQIFDGYVAKQYVSISSKKNAELMKRIEQVADQTSELVNLGIEFNPDKIQYTYSDMASLKQALIESASVDAKERAAKIVKKANGKIGKLKDASMGVFQITGTGEDVEDSYGGNFDIYSKEKVARITVRLKYELD